MTRVWRAAKAAMVLAAGAASAARGQDRADTLVYTVAVHPATRHLSIEARLTAPAGLVVLEQPPAQGPAGTHVAGFSATDDRGLPLSARRSRSGYVIQLASPGAVRFRYRLDVQRASPDNSTGTALDSTRLYAVTRSLFVAPDPTVYRKTGRPFPVVRVGVLAPGGWRVVAGWPGETGAFTPSSGDELLGATLAAARDFRLYDGRAAGARWRLAVRGRRYFSDSLLLGTVQASLEAAARALGPVPVPVVTYTADVGHKGRVSGSLQGLASVGLVWEPSEVLETPRGHDVFHETLHMWFGGAMESERWWTEGVTDYVAARLWAEWRGAPEDLAYLAFQSLSNYQEIEHRFRLTLAQETRQGVGGDNTELLVYRKGMLAGLLLDAAIRRSSGGRVTLDSAARVLLAAAGSRSSRRVLDTEIRAAVVALGGAETERVWSRVVAGTDPITEDDVGTALREVTGRAFDLPAPNAKTRKQLRGRS